MDMMQQFLKQLYFTTVLKNICTNIMPSNALGSLLNMKHVACACNLETTGFHTVQLEPGEECGGGEGEADQEHEPGEWGMQATPCRSPPGIQARF